MVDYVIVGAGSAGCVLANRLTHAGARVLLLEAGGSDRRLDVRIPAVLEALSWRRGLGLRHRARAAARRPPPVPAPRQDGGGLELDERHALFPTASTAEGWDYVRGNPCDYDGWVREGCQGWGWKDVGPVFRRMEDNQRGASADHGAGGPLPVSDQRAINPLSRAFVEAAAALGLPVNPDFNGAVQEGVGVYQVTQKRGRRASSADAFLRPVRGRRNFELKTGAHTTRVIVEGERAVGVEMRWRRRVEQIRAEAGVVLAAGAFNSPQLLMLSGIGPADDLRRLGIEVVADLPGVGGNLQDHPYVPLTRFCRQPVTLASAESVGNLVRFLVWGTGPLTSPVAEAGGFVRTRPELEAPDLQYHFAPSFFLEHSFANPEGHGFSLAPTLLCPTSRGRVTLRSTDPGEAPSIATGALSDEAEVEFLAEGLRRGREILLQPHFDPFRGPEHTPGEEIVDGEELRAFVRRSAELLYHPVGTCKMGTDPQAVVDSRLRVHGLRGLTVADASVMPRIVRGNTNAPR